MPGPFAVCKVEGEAIPSILQTARLGLKSDRANSTAAQYGGADTRGPVTKEGTNKKKTVARNDPKYIVEIEGMDVDELNLTKFIRSITVQEFDDQMSYCVLDIANEDGAFTDDRIFKAQNRLNIWTGYPSGNLEDRGTFYVKKPSFNFKGKDTIRLRGLSEEILMHQEAKRRIFKDMTDSDIASTIANEYGLVTDIEPTNTVYSQISQMNQTDLEFLFERSQLYGFVLKIFRGVLHFHQERKTESGLRMVYKEGEDSATLKSISFSLDTSLRGGRFTTTQVNPLSKDVIRIDSSTAPDRITEQVFSESDKPLIRAEDTTILKGRSTQHFLESIGQDETRSELSNIAQARGEQDRWLVSGTGSCVGLEKLHAGVMIEIVGVGRMGGHYLVKYAKHSISYRKGYSVSFKIKRAWVGKTARALQGIARPGAGIPLRRSDTDSDVLNDDVTGESEVVGLFDEHSGRLIITPAAIAGVQG